MTLNRETCAQALRVATASLRDAGIDTPERDARLLLADAMGIDHSRLTLHLGDLLPDQASEAFHHMVDQRRQRAPVSKIIGCRHFWGRSFQVNADVLDPRPETETLIALALQNPFAQMLDLGTGSGVLAITLLAERTGATGVATDVSPAALAVADRNARTHGVAPRLRLIESDWFAAIDGRFDLIVSNPPYIAAAEMPDLAPEVRDHDPHLALTDGADGLSAYRSIAAGSVAHLSPGGRLLVEIGAGQGGAVAAILAASGLIHVACHPDLDGRNRVISAFAPG